jgi:hypothetical protein
VAVDEAETGLGDGWLVAQLQHARDMMPTTASDRHKGYMMVWFMGGPHLDTVEVASSLLDSAKIYIRRSGVSMERWCRKTIGQSLSGYFPSTTIFTGRTVL